MKPYLLTCSFFFVCRRTGEEVFAGKESPPKKLKVDTLPVPHPKNHAVSFEQDVLEAEFSGEQLITPHSEATTTTSAEGAFLFDAVEEQEQEPPSSPDDIDIIATKMKATKLSAEPKKTKKKSSFLPIQHPYISTPYLDSIKRNKMVYLEVHLPSCTIQEDVYPSLEEREDGHQYLVIKEKMSEDLQFQDLFRSKLPAEMSNDDKSSIFLSRKDQLNAMKAKYKGDNNGEDEEEDTILDDFFLQTPFFLR